MIDSATRDVAKDVKASTQPLHTLTNGAGNALMPKTEESSDNKGHLSEIAAERAGKDSQEQDAAADSEAETLIQSPEKRKNVVGNAPTLHPTGSALVRPNGEQDGSTESGTKKNRKRKRDLSDEHRPQSHSPSSSPLSSPNPHAHGRDSESDISDTPRSARSYRARRGAPKGEVESANGASPDQTRRRRPSDIIPPTAKYQSKGIGSGTSDRRETRSATYPRPSSEDRSPSPRPTSRGHHRRGVSTQLTSGEFERKKRGRPPNISTKRNKSLDRAQSTSSGDDMSPPNPRPSLEKYDSRDRMSPAKPSGPRKFRDKNGRTFLSRACNNEDLDKVKQCFKERPNDLDEQDNAGNTPLQIASLEGYVDIVQFLLENGAEVDTRNIDQDSPLIDAVENGHLEVIKLLLDFGANPRLSNRRGDEPYELVPRDDENYKEIRKLIADAKEHDFVMRRKSSDNNNEANREGSSRPASAASPRDSPPLMDPRGIPPPTSRRRTGRSESTRNDLLWQSHTQENLRLLASKGNVQGVATILNVLQKAEPAAVIAAAKAGRDEVLQLILAIGDADPNPDPVAELKSGFDTPILAAIGRGNLKVIELLIDQTGFNPTKKFRGKTYYEIAQERKGTDWTREVETLKKAYDKYMSGKTKTQSPKKVREPFERAREKRARRSESPPSSSVRTSSSPTMTNKSLPDKTLRAARRNGKKEFSSPTERERRKVESAREDNSIAVTSDQEQTVHDKRGHKHRRSQSDLPLPPNLENENTQRRRRLVTGKEHRRSQSGVGGMVSDDSGSELDVKAEHQSAALKRNRSSLSPEPKDGSTYRPGVKKRRTVLESSPEETRPNQRIKPLSIGLKDAIMKTDPDYLEETAKGTERLSPEITMQDAAGEPDETIQVVESALKDVTASIESSPVDNAAKQTDGETLELAEQKAADESAADQQRRAEEEKVEADRVAAEKAEAERIAAEKEAADQAEKQRQADQEAEDKRKAEEAEARRQAEEAQAIRKIEEAEAKRKAEEVEARRRAEEEAAARKKEEEERRERYRREQEDIKRRQEEQIRQQHLEIERRRRESLPASLCYTAFLLQNGNSEARSPEWLSHFLPLKTFEEQKMDGPYPAATAREKWIANFQAAVLLGTSDLNLRNYTSFEKRAVTPKDREHLWKIFRNILAWDWHNSYSLITPITKFPEIEKEQRSKFMSMTELFWVKLSDFKDQVFRHDHLAGVELREQICSIVNRKQAPGVQPPQMANGGYSHVDSSLQINGGFR